MIIFLIIILFIIFLTFLENKIKSDIENFVSYTRCKKKKLKRLKKEIFDKHNIEYEEDSKKNWDLYLPCGLGNIENELKKIKISNNNQVIFGISGCDKIVKKNTLWELLEKYYGRNIAKTIMPESFVLTNSNDVKLFKNSFDKNKVYLIKRNIQRKKGIIITNNLKEILNINKKYKVVQEFISDTYIINKRVLNLRIYFMVKCINNNVTFYIHRLGKCLYSAKDLNEDKLDFNSRITNSYKTEKNIYDNNPLTLKELKIYLNKKKRNNGTKLFNNIDNLFKKICYAIKDTIYNSDNLMNNVTAQMFGVDIIFNNDMKPYILEINKGPDMVPKDVKDKKIKYKVELDMLELFNLVKINDKNYKNGYRHFKL